MVTAGYNYIYIGETIGGKSHHPSIPRLKAPTSAIVLMTNFRGTYPSQFSWFTDFSPWISPGNSRRTSCLIIHESRKPNVFMKTEKIWPAKQIKEDIFSHACYVFGFLLLGHDSKEKRFVDAKKIFKIFFWRFKIVPYSVCFMLKETNSFSLSISPKQDSCPQSQCRK